MFAAAISCLLISIVAALVGFGGWPDVTIATLARYAFLASVGGFAVSALSEIVDLKLRWLRRA